MHNEDSDCDDGRRCYGGVYHYESELDNDLTSMHGRGDGEKKKGCR